MDFVYVLIFLVAILVFYFDACSSKKKVPTENFTNFPNNGVNYGGTTHQPAGGYKGTTNFGKRNPSFQNFGKFGETPPRPRTNITMLGENCTNYPYDSTQDKWQTVCQQTYDVYPYGTQDFTIPLYVMGRAIGRTRQPRLMYNPDK